jgi:hypothetical protein
MVDISVCTNLSQRPFDRWLAASFALVLLLLPGLLSGVREMRDCRAQCVPAAGGGCVPAGGGGVLVAAGQQCAIEIGDVRVPLPAWAQAIIK